MAEQYDVIVIGGGPAGENAAGRTGKAGLKTVLIEGELLGGECDYWACMPSKVLLRPWEALSAVKRVPGAREASTGSIDFPQVLAWRDYMTRSYTDESQVSWVASVGSDLIRGHAKIDGQKKVLVTQPDGSVRELEASKAVVVATGSRSSMPPIPGLADAETWDNRKATSATEIPKHLIVLGGGAVGCELAQAWKSLGAEEVTIIEGPTHLLPLDEPFAGELVGKAFEERLGIQVLTGKRATAVDRKGEKVTVTLEGGATVTGDELLVALGRRPRTDDVGLETLGLEPGKKISVNDQMQAVDVPGGWLYAVGDVNGRNMQTYMGKYHGRIAGDHINGKEVAGIGDYHSSRVVFTDPQVASVGLTEAKAREQGFNVRAIEYGYGWSGGGSLMGYDVEGTCKWVVDEDRKVLVGATFVGPGAGEQIHAAAIAIAGEVTLDTLWHAVPPFPTISEFWLSFLLEYGY